MITQLKGNKEKLLNDFSLITCNLEIQKKSLLTIKLELKSRLHYIDIIAYHCISFYIIYLIFKSQFDYIVI